KRSRCGCRRACRGSTGGPESDRLVQTSGLVVPRRGDGPELLFVLAPVVRTEQQLAAIDLGGDVGLGAARIAAVHCGETVVEDGSGLSRCRCHFLPPRLRRTHVPVMRYNHGIVSIMPRTGDS